MNRSHWNSKVIAPATGLCMALAPSVARADEAQPATTKTTAGAVQQVLPLEELGLEDLMNIEVSTVSRQESTVGQSPAAVFVISPEMIRRSGATTIPELFRMVPGLNVSRLDSNKWSVNARGVNNTPIGPRFVNKLLVQVDGRTVYNPIFGGVYWDTVDYPLEDIERIEVIRGPGASVWGANAVNGIINILTKSAKDTQGGLANGGGGSEEHGFAALRYGDKLKNGAAYRVYGKGFERDRGFVAGGQAHDDWRAGRAGFRFDRAIGRPPGQAPGRAARRGTFTLQGDWFTTRSGQQLFVPANNPPTYIIDDTADEESNGGNLLARWTRDLGQNATWTLQAYYDRSDRRFLSDFLRFAVDTADVDFQRQSPLGDRHKLIYGAGGRLQKIRFRGSKFDNAFAAAPARLDVNRNVFSVFLQDEMKLSADRLSLTLGSKFEHNAYTGFEVQPTGRLLWTPTKKQSAWAAVSRAVRTPSLVETDLTLTTGPIAIPQPPGAALFPVLVRLDANPAFASEELLAYELGYRAQAADNLSVDVALFYNDYDNLGVAVPGAVVPGPAPGTFIWPFTAQNKLKGKTQGVEIAANWQATKRWQLHGAYSFLNMDLRADAGADAVTQNGAEVFEGRSPRHQVYLRSSWNLPRHLEFDLAGRYVDRLPGFTAAVKSYVALDARLGWRPRDDLELAVVGQNLLDRHHLESGATQFTQVPPVEIQRGVYGSVTYKW